MSSDAEGFSAESDFFMLSSADRSRLRGRGLTAAASRRGDPRSFERNTIPESGLAAECGGLREWLDHHVTIRQNHPLRREVVDVGRDFDEGETLLPANSPSHIHR